MTALVKPNGYIAFQHPGHQFQYIRIQFTEVDQDSHLMN
jgi:hypothetical protein